MTRRVVLLITAILASLGVGAAPGAHAQTQPGPSPEPLPEATGSVGCLAMEGSRVLESTRADQRHTPASVQKLAVTAAALERLGPEFRVHTRIEAVGELKNGRLDGDLVVRAAGDPTWSQRFFPPNGASSKSPIRRLATSVRASGIRALTGDLVIDLSRFPGRPAPASRAMNEIAFGYAAPTGGLAIEENAINLRMAPGKRVGQPASFEASEPIDIVNLTTTAPATRHEKGTVDFQASWHDGRLVIRGEYPISEPAYDIEVAVDDGARRAAERLLEALQAEGVDIDGEIRLAKGRSAKGTVVADIASPPLAEWLPPILADSHNWLSEMLLRVLAAEELGEGRTGEGLAWLEAYLLDELGLAAGSIALDDASGISPYNLWTPRAVVRLLEWSWSRPWRGHYVAALSRPDRGTLRGWPRLPSSVAAKTGTQRHTLGLAGFLLERSAARGPIFFACLLDQRLEPRAELRREIADRIWRWHKLRAHD